MYERLIVGRAPTMPNSSPSKLALWMEYSLADLDNDPNLQVYKTNFERIDVLLKKKITDGRGK